ncbi:MAG: hypothetical protein KJ667_00170, partial [Alphaproteobacteria bacterium]|nr:hypothetical protein [Alphaproteobacteria bacterium]
MTHRFKMLRAGLYALVLPCVTLTALVPYAHAETPPREALLGLARNFVDRVGGGFKRADDYLAQIMPDDMRAAESFVDIPDGEILLLKIKLGKTYLSDTVMGIKEGRDVLLSLRDFTAIARFAIDVRPEEGIAEGWFIREDQKFQLDTNTGQVIAGDQRFTFDSDMVRVQDGDIYVRGQALGTWLGFEMNLEFGQQIAEIESEQKWPVENMLARRQRRLAKQQPSAQLPRQDNPYTLATVPNVDIALRQSYERDGDGGDARKSTDYTVSTAGDLAGHTAVGVFTGNDENKLSSARLTLSKESENPDLLGPLKARRYEFGDIGATQVPLSGNARAGLGVRVSSSNANVVTGSVTQITGDAQPGWDVELSRNNQILDLVTVGDDGRYVFDDVRLLSGENDFKIVQYGPLGELREDRQKVISSTNLLSGGRGVYDVSVTAADTQIWQKDDSKTLDQGNPQLSGTYEMQVASDMTVKTGARSITQNDDRKNFVYAGTAKSFGNVLANADASYDLDGALSTQLGARVRMGNHSASATLGYQGKDFGIVN